MSLSSLQGIFEAEDAVKDYRGLWGKYSRSLDIVRTLGYHRGDSTFQICYPILRSVYPAPGTLTISITVEQ